MWKVRLFVFGLERDDVVWVIGAEGIYRKEGEKARDRRREEDTVVE